MLPKRHKTQRGAGDWRPYFPDRPPQFNRDIQALVPRWQAEHATGAPTNEDYYAWIQTQPEWATLKRGDISISAVQEKARQATAQSFKDDAQRATPDEIGRQRYGEAWDTYSAETKRGLAMAPIFKEVGAQVSKTNPLLGAIIPGLADPIITNGLKAIYTFLIEGGVEVAKALLKGDPKSALTAIAKKSAPAFMQAFTASRQDPTPLALKLREFAEQIAGHDPQQGKGVRCPHGCWAAIAMHAKPKSRFANSSCPTRNHRGIRSIHSIHSIPPPPPRRIRPRGTSELPRGHRRGLCLLLPTPSAASDLSDPPHHALHRSIAPSAPSTPSPPSACTAAKHPPSGNVGTTPQS